MKLTDAEKTRRLAEGCMGWEVFPLDRDGYSEAPRPKLIEQITGVHPKQWAVFRKDGKSELWDPLTDEAHAAEVRDRMRELGWETQLTYGTIKDWAGVNDCKGTQFLRHGKRGTMTRVSSEVSLLALGLAKEEEL